MRFHYHRSVIILTLLLAPGVHATDVSSCTVESSGPADLSWLEELTGVIRDEAAPIRPEPVRPEPVRPEVVHAEPVVETYPVEDLDRATESPEEDLGTSDDYEEMSTSRYDLNEPWISKLRREVRQAAAKCRERRGRTICGVQRSKYLCYRAVKEALRDTGMVQGYMPGAAAKDAHQDGILLAQGFKNIFVDGMRSSGAPLGAVLVYDGGSKRCRNQGRWETCGHIEVKLNSNEYCSDYCKSTPVDVYLNRKLIGIYVKE